MSEENVEAILRGVEALNRRDADAFVAVVSPEVEWETNPELVGVGRIYRGRAGVREWIEQLLGLETWESINAEVDEITEAGDDRVVVGLRVEARGRGSGALTELSLWQVCWFVGGLVRRRQAFWTRREALEAARSSE